MNREIGLNRKRRLVIEIDLSLNYIGNLEQRLLGEFIAQNPGKAVIYEANLYWVRIIINNKLVEVGFKLSNTIYRRLRKSGKKEFGKLAYRYEVMGHQELADWGFSDVYPVEKTLRLMRKPEKGGGLRLCPTEKQKARVIKIGKTNGIGNESLNLLAPHLHAKQPIPNVFQGVTTGEIDYVVSVLKRMPGKNLFDIIFPNKKRLRTEKRLTSEQKLQLALSLLKALKEQTQAQGLVHRDIKPENIMVDFKPGVSSPEVNIIDFELSKKSNEADSGDYIGTFLYMSPEMLQSQEANLCSDIFAMGRVLCFLFSSDPGFFTKEDLSNLKYLAATLSRDTLLPEDDIKWLASLGVPKGISDIFQGYSDIQDEHKEELVGLLKKMCEFKYSERILLKEAIGVLKKVCLERKQKRDQLAERAAVPNTRSLLFKLFPCSISENTFEYPYQDAYQAAADEAVAKRQLAMP